MVRVFVEETLVQEVIEHINADDRLGAIRLVWKSGVSSLAMAKRTVDAIDTNDVYQVPGGVAAVVD